MGNEEFCQMRLGDGGENSCNNQANGTHEHSVRVCCICGKGLEKEGFTIEWDHYTPCAGCPTYILECEGFVWDMYSNKVFHIKCAPKEMVKNEDHYP